MGAENKDADKDTEKKDTGEYKQASADTLRLGGRAGGAGEANQPGTGSPAAAKSSAPTGLIGTPSTVIDAAWLQKQSLRELAVALDLISQEIKRRLVADHTDEIGEEQIEIAFPEFKKAATQEFKKLPAATSKPPEETEPVTWRIVLVSSRPGDVPITAEIRDDVTIGRATAETPVDIDLIDFGAGEKGVSRQHAMLHPTREELLLRDLGSTNGTYCGSERATLGRSLPVKDGDVIRLGGLYMKVFVVHKPA